MGGTRSSSDWLWGPGGPEPGADLLVGTAVSQGGCLCTQGPVAGAGLLVGASGSQVCWLRGPRYLRADVPSLVGMARTRVDGACPLVGEARTGASAGPLVGKTRS